MAHVVSDQLQRKSRRVRFRWVLGRFRPRSGTVKVASRLRCCRLAIILHFRFPGVCCPRNPGRLPPSRPTARMMVGSGAAAPGVAGAGISGKEGRQPSLPRRQKRRSYVAVLWEGILNCLRVGHRSFCGSGRPRGPGRPFQKMGELRPPHLLQGLRGPLGRPDPHNDRFPTKCYSHPKCSHENVDFSFKLAAATLCLSCVAEQQV